MKRFLLFCAALLLSAGAQAFTIHLLGDSTMSPKNISSGTVDRGWGMMLPNFLDDSVKVINYARGGRSTKSTIAHRHWEEAKTNMKAGDYLFMQFGHNDQKEYDPDRYSPPYGLYQENLRLFCNTALEKGVTPVIITPICRRLFNDGVLDRSNLGDYADAARKVAAELGVALIDANAMTAEWLESLGDEASKPYFCWFEAGKYAFHPEARSDNTHLNVRGARKVAELVCSAFPSCLPELAAHLVHHDFVVAKDGTGDFFTVQEAVDAAPDYLHQGVTDILIREGVYREMVTIPANKQRLHISGEGPDRTVIEFGKYAEAMWPDTDIKVGTSGSASMYIHASHVTLENLTVANTAGSGDGIAQAVALFTDGDFLFFHNCRFLGNQDTVYTFGRYGYNGGVCRNYFLDCYIEGTTDFIFGPSIVYFENCTIHSKKNSYVTAASTFKGQKYGYVFRNCRLTADEGITRCYLGRPWGAYARTVFIGCELGGHIVSEGWHDWEKPGKPDTKKNSYYAEYGCTGPGASLEGRVKWAHKLTARQAAEYTFENIMYQSGDGAVWNPFDNR